MTNSKTAFVIMPFSKTLSCDESQWQDIYEHVFKPAIENCGYTCSRSIPSTGNLIKSIVRNLRDSKIALADITDHNPNVFYELGVRHSISKRTIIVTQDTKFLPSDLKGYWTIVYGTSPGQVTKFKNDIQELIKKIELDPEKSDSPVSEFFEEELFGLNQFSQRDSIKKLNSLFTELSGNLLILEKISYIKNDRIYITTNSLELLLSTLYVDLGPDLLKKLHNLSYYLTSIKYEKRIDQPFREMTIELIRELSNEIHKVRKMILTGDFKEPADVSLMQWISTQSYRINCVSDGLFENNCFSVLEHSLSQLSLKDEMCCTINYRSTKNGRSCSIEKLKFAKFIDKFNKVEFYIHVLERLQQSDFINVMEYLIEHEPQSVILIYDQMIMPEKKDMLKVMIDNLQQK